MTRLFGHTPEQAAEWLTRGPEPVEIDMEGWETEICLPSEYQPNHRGTTWTKASAIVRMSRIWDRSLYVGAPMKEASSREVKVAGKDLQLITTSMWRGFAKELDVVWLTGDRWTVRFTFEGCTTEEIDQICSRVRVVDA